VPAEPVWIQEIEESPAPTTLSSQEVPTIPLAPSTEPELPSEKPAVFGRTRPLPSWLVGPADATETPEPEKAAETMAEPALPDWLKDEKQPDSTAQSGNQQSSASEQAPELPDWLKNLEAEQEETLAVSPIPVEPVEVHPEVTISSVPAEMLAQAQDALAKGRIELSMTIYSQMIQQGQYLEESVHDLRDALYRYPVESEIWQTLGDAYIRSNHVQDALDAYTKAEELLK
jgi:tetratricopeptide (TPR) repeat protein